MKRSQSDVTLSKSQEMSSTNQSFLDEKFNSLEIEEDLQSTISTSSNSSNSSASSKPSQLQSQQQQSSFPIPKDRKPSSAATTPNLSSVTERNKPKKTMSISNLDLSGKKYATISSGNGGSVDLSPKKPNKMKSVSNFFKKSTSHNNLMEVNVPINGEAINGSSADSPSLNSSNSSISSNSSSANQKTLKSKFDSFFSINKGNRSSLKYEFENGEDEDSDFDSSSDEELPVNKKHSKRRQLKLFVYTQKSKNRENNDPMLPLDLTAESVSVPCTPLSGQTPSPIGGEAICNSSSINSDQQKSSLTPRNQHQKLERKSMSDPNILSLIEEETTTISTNNNSNQTEEDEEDVEDLRKFLERRLIRRPTVAELKLDNILFQTEFEDAAKEQTKTEIKSQKLFVGTRPSKKRFFNSVNSNISNNSVNVTLKIEDEEESHKRILSKNLLDNEDESDVCRILILPCNGWRREVESEDYQSNLNIKQSLCIEEIENEFPHYFESFCKDKHKNYLANNNSELGPVVISIKREAERTLSYRKLKKKKKEKESISESCPNFSIYNYNNLNNPQAQLQIQQQQQQQQSNLESYERKFKTIIRTKDGEDRFYLSSGKSSPHELINTIKSIFLSEYPELQFQKIPNNSETRKMLQYWETAQMTKDYKIGLLYRKNGQINENDFFSNNDESPEYKEFLEFIGEKVKLKGWENFKGGLDVKNDTTGLHSIYKTKEISINENKKFNVQIMFHVSTLLPFYPNDEQQLERKRHIGNDIVVIIFQDINCSPPFRPNMIKSEFNHVFVVIQPLEKLNPNEITKYSVSITYKEGVSSSTPFFPSQKIWKKDNVFLDHLLTKLINAEKASYYSPAFSDKMKRTRLTLLKTIVNTFQQNK